MLILHSVAGRTASLKPCITIFYQVPYLPLGPNDYNERDIAIHKGAQYIIISLWLLFFYGCIIFSLNHLTNNNIVFEVNKSWPFLTTSNTVFWQAKNWRRLLQVCLVSGRHTVCCEWEFQGSWQCLCKLFLSFQDGEMSLVVLSSSGVCRCSKILPPCVKTIWNTVHSIQKELALTVQFIYDL